MAFETWQYNAAQMKADAAAMVGAGRGARGRFKLGDVIIGLNDQPLSGGEELIRRIEKQAVGDKVNLTVVRDGTARNVQVRLSQR